MSVKYGLVVKKIGQSQRFPLDDHSLDCRYVYEISGDSGKLAVGYELNFIALDDLLP